MLVPLRSCTSMLGQILPLRPSSSRRFREPTLPKTKKFWKVPDPELRKLLRELSSRRRSVTHSHCVPGSTGSRNGNEDRDTSFFKTSWNDEYKASARPKLTWIVIQFSSGRRSRNDGKERDANHVYIDRYSHKYM
jgi:hypothetical protein